MLKTTAILLALSVPAVAHTQARRAHSKPAPVPLESCLPSLANMHSISGSIVYVRLRYVIAALSSAQESVSDLGDSLKELNTETNPSIALASLLTGTDQVKNSLQCAASIMNQYPASDDADRTIKALYVADFSREADAISNLMAHVKEQFIRPASASPGNATYMRDAERISAMNESQNKAATGILETTTYVLLKSIDLSDTNAKTAPYLAVSCQEYTDLVKWNSSLDHAEKSAYTQPAFLIQKVLDEHKCKD